MEVYTMSFQSITRSILQMVIVVAAAIPLQAQQDPNAVLNDLNQAQAKSQSRDWAAAVPLWERLVAGNPYVGWWWYSLGTAQFNTGEYRKAISSFEKASELGAFIPLESIAFDIARSHARLKDREATIQVLQRALDLGVRHRDRIGTNEDFAFLRGDPRFKSMTGEIDKAHISRTDGWRHDISFLETEVKRMGYDPFHKVSQAQFASEAQRLRAEIPNLTDNQIIVRIMHLMTMVGDGHTGVAPQVVSSWKTVPLQFELFQEGLYIVAADRRYEDLVGKQVLRFGNHPTEQVIQALGSIIGRDKDNPQSIKRNGPRFARFPAILNGLGLQPQSESIVFTVREADGTTRTAEVTAAKDDSEYSRIAGHPSWVTLFQGSPGPLPLYLKDRRKNYWFEIVPNTKIVYFQFNLVVQDRAEPLDAFLQRLFRYIDEHKIEKLIIDMRWNNGGNGRLAYPVLSRLTRAERINQPGNLFLIVGRYTFSAAPIVASVIESHANAILVGEPTPTGPNFIGEDNFFNLPYSQLPVSVSDQYHQTTWSTDTRTALTPLLLAPFSVEAYRAKRDLALETILAYRGNQ
jgi:tetratricopeptide (TPR) repeat protein